MAVNLNLQKGNIYQACIGICACYIWISETDNTFLSDSTIQDFHLKSQRG